MCTPWWLLLNALPIANQNGYDEPNFEALLLKKKNFDEFNAQGQLFSQAFPLQGPTLEFN